MGPIRCPPSLVKERMERELIRLPLLLFFLCVVTGGLTSAYFPVLGWFIAPVLVVALVCSVVAAFFTTQYTTYQRTVRSLLTLFFCFFMVMVIQTALVQWLPPQGPVLVTGAYFFVLVTVYMFRYRRERQANWHDFNRTLTSPTLAIEDGKVKRIVRTRKNEKRNASSSAAANIGGGLGVAALSVVGAVFGARGKELLLLVVVAGFMVAPFFVLRYLVINSVGIREVRKIERERAVHFEIDNVVALQEARRKFFFARLLNPRLRQQL